MMMLLMRRGCRAGVEANLAQMHVVSEIGVVMCTLHVHVCTRVRVGWSSCNTQTNTPTVVFRSRNFHAYKMQFDHVQDKHEHELKKNARVA